MNENPFKTFAENYVEFRKEQDAVERKETHRPAESYANNMFNRPPKKKRSPLTNEERLAIIRADREMREERERQEELDKPFELDGAL